jgi:hypothetical protein
MRIRSAIVVAVTTAIAMSTTAGAAVEAPRQTWVPDGEVRAVAVSGSTAYIGGNFTRIAPYTGSSALFNASSGDLKKPWPEVAGVVNAVAPDSAGGWYLGGDFTSVGGVPRTDLAHVMKDGTVDPSWAPVTDGLVRALAVTADTVFAGGDFSTANGTSRSSLAGFSPATGALTDFVGGVTGRGSSLVTLFDPLGVYSLLVAGSTLYTVGEFNQALSGSTVLERLRGAAFNIGNSQIEAWNPKTNRLINGLALDSDGTDLFIGGRFSRVNVTGDPFSTGEFRNGVAKVSQSTGAADPNWVAALQPSTDLTTLMVFGSRLYVAGTVRVGSETWPVASLGAPNNQAVVIAGWEPKPAGSVQSLAAAGSTVYIGSGAFVDNVPQPAIIGVDATNFPEGSTPSFAPALGRGRQALPSGQSAGVRAIGVSGADVVAGGTFTNVGGVDRRNLAAIDLNTGEATAFNPPMRGQFSAFANVNALAISSDGLVWAGGTFITEGPDQRSHLAAFDPASGALASFHRDPTPGASSEAVSALVASDRTVYLAGDFSQVGGMPRRNVAAVQHLPGDQGTVLPFDGDVDGPVRALALAGDKVYIGGQFTAVNGSIASLRRERRNLAALDATTGLDRGWDPDADNVVRALAIMGDTVFAGGEFTTVNRGVARQRLAAFDAAGGGIRDWNPGADAAVRSLATYGPTVFAGGDFATVGGVPRAGVAELDALTGAPGTFSAALDTEERGGPMPPVTRVGALFASPATGLLMGGSYVMNSPTPRAANLSLFGLAPLPAPGGAGSQTTGDSTDPNLAFSASRKRFRSGRGATRADGNATPVRATAQRRRTPRGTTLTLRLSEAARVKFEVLVRTRGRRVGRRCVKQTRRNRNRRRCIRLVAKKPAFTRSAPLGTSRVSWSGRLGRKALKPGSYILRATPTDLAGNTGRARQLSIRIVRR